VARTPMRGDSALAALSRLEAGMAKLQTDVAAVDGKVDRLRMDVMARLDRHETKLTEIHDDITVTLGAANKAELVNDHTREEVRALHKLLNEVIRTVRTLATRVGALEGKTDGDAAE